MSWSPQVSPSPSPSPSPTATTKFSTLNCPISGDLTSTAPAGVANRAAIPLTSCVTRSARTSAASFAHADTRMTLPRAARAMNSPYS